MIYFQTMKNYELTIVLDGKATAAKKKKVTETVEKLVTVAKGKLGKPDDWGEINGKIFLHFSLEIEADQLKNLSTKLSQESDIIKQLIIKK